MFWIKIYNSVVPEGLAWLPGCCWVGSYFRGCHSWIYIQVIWRYPRSCPYKFLCRPSMSSSVLCKRKKNSYIKPQHLDGLHWRHLRGHAGEQTWWEATSVGILRGSKTATEQTFPMLSFLRGSSSLAAVNTIQLHHPRHRLEKHHGEKLRLWRHVQDIDTVAGFILFAHSLLLWMFKSHPQPIFKKFKGQIYFPRISNRCTNPAVGSQASLKQWSVNGMVNYIYQIPRFTLFSLI